MQVIVRKATNHFALQRLLQSPKTSRGIFRPKRQAQFRDENLLSVAPQKRKRASAQDRQESFPCQKIAETNPESHSVESEATNVVKMTMSFMIFHDIPRKTAP